MIKTTKNNDLDKARLDWLSVPGRTVNNWDEDAFQSFHVERKQVCFYVHGKYTVVKGDNLRDAVDKAMLYFQIETTQPIKSGEFFRSTSNCSAPSVSMTVSSDGTWNCHTCGASDKDPQCKSIKA